MILWKKRVFKNFDKITKNLKSKFFFDYNISNSTWFRTGGKAELFCIAGFLSLNLRVEAIHEPLGVNDFGTKMPDIRTLRNFNTFGNNEVVRDFWKNKFNSLKGEIYAETNHTLAKCGLIENLIN